jgi:hypothetical protein
MMQGVVNLRREATLTVVVGNSNRQLQAINAVLTQGKCESSGGGTKCSGSVGGSISW